MAVTKWWHYLVGNHFIIRTDHQSLKHLLDQRLNTAIQHKWMTKLLGLDYKIEYKKGVDNQVANALSRRHTAVRQEELGFCVAIIFVQPGWMEELQKSYEGDIQSQDIMSQLTLDPNSHADYILLDGILKYQGKIYVGGAKNI